MIELPEWVEKSKTMYAPETTSDNEKKIIESNKGKATENSAKIISANINLTDKARPAFYVKNTTGETIYLDINGEEHSVGIGENIRIDSLTKLSPLNYDDQIIATLKLADGTVAHKVQYSINAYCASKTGTTDAFGDTTIDDVAVALYNYGLAAERYLVK